MPNATSNRLQTSSAFVYVRSKALQAKSEYPAPARPDRFLSRYVRLPELRRMVSLSPATIWRKTRNGSFPPAIKLSERVTAWNREAVETWLAEREAA